MKHLFAFLCAFLVVVLLAVPCFASSGETEQGSVSDPNESTSNIVEDASEEDLGEYVGTTVYALNPVTSSDATGLKAVLLQFVGDWDSIVIEHAYESSNGYTNYVREIQLDYPWLCSAGFLAIMIFCLFRLGGSLLCRV